MNQKYICLYPSRFKLDGGAMFGIIPKPLWNKRIPADEYNRIEMSLRSLLIQRDNKIIIIDSGCGDYQGQKFNERFALASTLKSFDQLLAQHQLKREQVSDVILTHLHFDHCGGLLCGQQLELTFPNATLHLHRRQYQHAQNPTARDKGSYQIEHIENFVGQYEKKDQLHWLEGENGFIVGDLNFQTCHGHTPYQILPYNSEMMYGADLVPTAHHVDLPWVMGYDLHPGKSTEDRLEVYQFLIEKNLYYIFDHDLEFIAGRLRKKERGFEFYQLISSQQASSEEFTLNSFSVSECDK